MLIDISRIFSPEDLQEDFERVCERLKTEKEAYIFQNNKPTHVIMTIERYKELMDDNTLIDPLEDVSDDGLETLLNKIGKSTFVEYYYVFKEDNNPEEKLSETDFTLNSRRSRSSSARKIFREGLEIAALNKIIQSSRLEEEILNVAKEILEIETGKVLLPTVDYEDLEDEDLKIGKMARTFITRFIQDGIITESEIQTMTETVYSKEIFNLNFAVIKRIDKNIKVSLQKKDQKGYNRYYDNVISKGGEQYLICSQWVDNLHKASFEKWLKSKLKEILIDLIDELDSETEFTIKGLLKSYWTYVPYQTRKSLGKDFYIQVRDNRDIEILDKINNIQVYKKL